MIRIFKTKEIPASLQKSNCTRYDGQDVQNTLVADQHRKCYLCEQDTHHSFDIEHLKPKADYPALKYKWENLFLACPYCNGRKPNSALILDPSQSDIEVIIEQRLNGKEISFTSNTQDESTLNTIGLLSKLFNGENHIRDVKCRELFKDIEQEITCFLELLVKYKNNPREENKQALNDSLKIDKEFLGFKYWILKDFGFYDEFCECVEWNKSKR